MSLKICESFRRILFSHERKFMVSAWSRNSVRGVKSFEEIPEALRVPPLGSMPYFDTAGGLTYLQKVVDFHHKALGPIFRANFDGNDIIFVSDADANVQIFQAEGKYPKSSTLEAWRLYMEETGKRKGLFFMDDESWHKARSVFEKIIMKQDSMTSHVNRVFSVCYDLGQMWRNSPPKNLKHQIYCWNVECIGEIAFGKNFGYVEALRRGNYKNIEKRELVEVLYKVYLESAKLIGEVSIKEIKERKAVQWIKFCEAMEKILQYSDIYVQETIEDCKITNPTKSIRESIVYKALIEEGLDEEIIKGAISDLFLGSYDTMSHTALWALYILGKNPDVANKAREDTFSAMKREGELNFSIATEIPYINGIIKEVIRLYPPVPFINRTMAIDAELCGYFVPAGNAVTSSLLTMGRDSANFTDPLQFQPERWFGKTSKYNKKIVLKDYAPFARGARSCIGKKIAEFNLSLLLVKILTTFEWTVEEELEPILRLVTVPNKDFQLNLKSI